MIHVMTIGMLFTKVHFRALFPYWRKFDLMVEQETEHRSKKQGIVSLLEEIRILCYGNKELEEEY
ncbi:hypothetical protein L195_g011995 [Trifolium pratense]|uniref:Uncharacterized protein n=1 Tax=Trifolium pratense TaxID=57577 RepID=A0A2K3PJ37_TRIPR|nr:hypothetical protein L195_g011995 [Trifolium pratense]